MNRGRTGALRAPVLLSGSTETKEAQVKKGGLIPTFGMLLFAVTIFPASPVSSQDKCEALQRLRQLAAQWERLKVLEPSRIQELGFIIQDIEDCLDESVPKPDFSGMWITPFGTMEITQTGNRIQGTYEQNHGEISGDVIGNVLVGSWSEAPSYQAPNDKGNLELLLSMDRKTFTGRWRYGSEGEWNEGLNGRRQ